MTTPTLKQKNRAPLIHAVSMKAPAKINVSLVVFDKRPDQFHDLHTIMATISLHDTLHISLADKAGIKLSCEGLPCPTTEDNLVWRAAKLLADDARIEAALHIHLEKHIPAGGGLGGASSNAAAVLVALNRLWNLEYPLNKLSELASQLGSDIPFFLYGPVALCTGRGEIIKRLPLRCKQPLLLILPGIHTPTAQIYKHYEFRPQTVDDDIRIIRYFLRRGDLDSLLSEGINSLTPVTMKQFESLNTLRCTLKDLGIGPVHMTGSGSTLFVTNESEHTLTEWAKAIESSKLAQTYVVGFNTEPDLIPEVHHADL